MKLTFRHKPSWRDRYRQLLTEDWTKQTLIAAKDLLLEQLQQAGVSLRYVSEDESGPAADRPSLYPIPLSASDELREHLEAMNYQLHLEHEHRRQSRARRPDRAQQELVAIVSFLLAFPAWPLRSDREGEPIRPTVEGQTDLFDDTRSILYLCAAYELLPEVAAARWSPERDGLLQAMYTHASLVWQKSPAHQSYLFSVFYDSIGEDDRAAEALHRAFTVTEPRDHDYFTRAFAYWSYQSERGNLEAATAFAFRLHREVPPELVRDAEDLIHQSVELKISTQRHKRSLREPR